jgi:hypothetical protein
MPTPFMHIAVAHRLSADSAVPPEIRAVLHANWGPFLLGSVAPDARVSSGLRRTDTHFFDYQAVIDPPAPVVMLTQHPSLRRPLTHDAAHAAFVAGYVAHLGMDEQWCTDALYPFFDSWGTRELRFKMLHMLLSHLDARDYVLVPRSDYQPLQSATPVSWLPFIGDADLVTWRDLIAKQLAPEGHNQTFEILGSRIGLTVAEMGAFIADAAQMQAQLWDHVPPERLAVAEESMYQRVRAIVTAYYEDL